MVSFDGYHYKILKEFKDFNSLWQVHTFCLVVRVDFTRISDNVTKSGILWTKSCIKSNRCICIINPCSLAAAWTNCKANSSTSVAITLHPNDAAVKLGNPGPHPNSTMRQWDWACSWIADNMTQAEGHTWVAKKLWLDSKSKIEEATNPYGEEDSEEGINSGNFWTDMPPTFLLYRKQDY